MENKAFDDALRGWMDGEDLPATTPDWQRMATRLDQHDSIAPVPVIHAPRQQHYRWLLPLAAAAVLCAVVFRTAFYKNETAAPVTAVSVQKNAVAPPDKAGVQPEEKPTAAPAAAAPAQPAAAAFRPSQKAITPVPAKEPAALPAASDTAVLAQNTERIAPARTDKTAGDTKLPLYTHAELPSPAPGSSRAALGVFGGYNIGQAKHDFTVGVVVSKKLGGRVHLETNVAVVSGSYDSYQGVPYQAGPTSGPGVSMATGGPAYESAPQQLLYLQASPSVSYEVYKGFSAGGGIDAQRLLSASSAAQLVNSAGKEAPQPDWDFGLTGRMDYQVAKKLRAGFVYRNSVYGSTKNGGDAARRNYLLVQLGYTIF